MVRESIRNGFWVLRFTVGKRANADMRSKTASLGGFHYNTLVTRLRQLEDQAPHGTERGGGIADVVWDCPNDGTMKKVDYDGSTSRFR